MRKTIIFDLDGTLLDTSDDLSNSVNFALKTLDFPTKDIKIIKSFIGNGIRNLVIRSLPADSSDAICDQAVQIMLTHYTEHCCDYTHPYDGIVELLDELMNNNYKLAVVSNKAQKMVTKIIGTKLNDYFPIYLGENPKFPRKPNPDLVFECLREMGTSVDDAIYIGDSEVDLLTAKNAGIPCIIVNWGFRTIEQLNDYGIHDSVSSVGELKSAILNL